MKNRTTNAALAALLMASAGWGCDDDSISGNPGGTGTPPETCEERGDCEGDETLKVIKIDYALGDEVRPVQWPITEPSNPGFAEPGSPSEPGALNGGWRIGTADVNNAPVAYIDLTQAANDDTPTCSFMLGAAVDPALKGNYGRCSNATISGNTLTVEFAPSTGSTDSWRLAMTESAGSWRGTLSDFSGSMQPLAVTMAPRKIADEIRVPPNAVPAQ